jgi:regulator of protease activity HflC (stomatin/prohibitin superfamily)
MQFLRRFTQENRVALIVTGLICAFLILFFAPRVFITVKAGEGGVHYRRFFGGTVRDNVFGEGLHVIWPWDKLAVYNVRVQENQREVEVLDKTGLRYTLNISIRFHPEYDVLGVLHQRVGPDYAEKIVFPEVEAVLRTTAGNFDAAELYTTKYNLLARIVNESLAEIGENFLVIDDVIIRSIDLPDRIRLAIEKKREQEQLAAAYTYRLQTEEAEAKRRVIEANGFQEANDIVSRSLNPDILKWKGIEATLALSTSTNSKVVVVGTGSEGLPIILGADK